MSEVSTSIDPRTLPTRERLLHALYEAAELEHNLMCTYLYAAFSLRDGESEGLTQTEAAAVAGWRRTILRVALDEMGHLTAVWNITSALGGSPRFGRANFPLDPGMLPAGVVVRLAPFSDAVLQHFIHLERPEGSAEHDGEGFAPAFAYTRAVPCPRITPMATDYETVGVFYKLLGENLQTFVNRHGEAVAFAGDPALQLSHDEVDLTGARPVICSKTALAAFQAIVDQGEGAPADAAGSHYQSFLGIRAELRALKAARPDFEPAWPAACNPLLRRPIAAQGRVWIEDEHAAALVDAANTGYALMLRLLAYSYVVPRPSAEKTLAVDLAVGLMRAVTGLAERAARLPAGSSYPGVNAGMSFSALRDSAPFPPGKAARLFFSERLQELSSVVDILARSGDARTSQAARMIAHLATRGRKGFQEATPAAAPATAPAANAANGGGSRAPAPALSPSLQANGAGAQQLVTTSGLSADTAKAPAPHTPPVPTQIEGVDHIEGKHLTLLFEVKKCIHSRFCVTWAPKVFLANVEGPWINPDDMDVERLAEIAHVCPSGAIRYKRKDGRPEEGAPPVNLVAIREAGPYAVRGDLRLDGEPIGYRATLCRCGASKNKPYCDGSHHDIAFAASGEPATTEKTAMLPERNGVLAIDQQLDGPLYVRGNLEITSGTGRMVARVTSAKLCRCGGSNTKPFCDGTHARIGFRST